MLMINQKLEELDDRLNVLLGNILVNYNRGVACP